MWLSTTAKKSCRCGKYGSFKYFLFLSQFKGLKPMVVNSNSSGAVGTPTGASNDEESDVMTTMEKLEAEAKDVSEIYLLLFFFKFSCLQASVHTHAHMGELC